MTKTIAKIGNSQGIILDSAFLDLARLRLGDQLSVTIHDGGAITLTPVRTSIDAKVAAASAKRLIRRNSKLFKRLS
ncbi:MAG: AbrB family transcriptional regulator [Chthoniobacterales bacterium]|nr:AbrB family transcriptional regulator [Chthoniobacterales bacterium]